MVSSIGIDPRRTEVNQTEFWKWVKALSARDVALNERLSQAEADIIALKNNIAIGLLSKERTPGQETCIKASLCQEPINGSLEER